jgi:hypothetical protein
MKMPIKGSEFHVLLGDIKLSAESESRIQAGIQSLVNSELVAYKPNPDDSGRPSKNPFGPGGNPHIVIPPIKWPGYILMRLKDINVFKENINQVFEIQNLSKEIVLKG